jgi:hypothetical protein
VVRHVFIQNMILARGRRVLKAYVCFEGCKMGVLGFVLYQRDGRCLTTGGPLTSTVLAESTVLYTLESGTASGSCGSAGLSSMH